MRLGFWLGVLLSIVVVEAAYRSYLYLEYVVGSSYFVTTVDRPQRNIYIGTPNNVRGPYEPGVTVSRAYDDQGELFSTIRYRVNNLGWVSKFDYQIEKPPTEYRIAIIGDSMTASVNNELPWPDFLQDYLNQDGDLLSFVGKKQVTVLNIASPGSTLTGMANKLLDAAMRFDPDLVVVNFPAAAIARGNEQLIPAEERDFSRGPEAPNALPPAELNIGGVEIRLFGCDAPVILANPSCRVNPAWYVPPSTPFESEDLRRIKTELAWRIVSSRVLLSLRPLFVFDLLGDPVIPRGSAVPPPLSGRSPANEAVDALAMVERIQPNAMVTHNPIYWTITGERSQELAALKETTDLAASRGITIVDVTDFMPLAKGKDEWRRWYNIPKDGHFSDYGATVYARAMEEVLREHIMGAVAITPDLQKCVDAYAVFREGQALLPTDQFAAVAKFAEASSLLPQSAVSLARAGTYRLCGFLPDMDFERAQVLLADDDEADNAMAALDRVLAVLPDRLDALHIRGDLKMRAGDAAGAAADYGVAVGVANDSVQLWTKYGNALLAAGETSQAIDAWTSGLAIDPASVTLLTRRGAGYIAAGRLDEARTDYRAALSITPGNLGALRGLADVSIAQGQDDAAIGYYGDAIAAAPDAVWAYLARAKIYERLGRPGVLADYASALRIAPDNVGIWTKYGLLLRDAGEMQQAIDAWTSGINVEPTSVTLLLLRAAALVKAEQPDQAKADYEAVVGLAPENLGALKGLAEVSAAQGLFEDAVRSYSAVLVIEPQTIWALAGRAKAYDGLGRADDAAADRERVKALRAAVQ
jgi:tetratricopeptide (TPR) repeat protein